MMRALHRVGPTPSPYTHKQNPGRAVAPYTGNTHTKMVVAAHHNRKRADDWLCFSAVGARGVKQEKRSRVPPGKMDVLLFVGRSTESSTANIKQWLRFVPSLR
jgi:hypothetical protein